MFIFVKRNTETLISRVKSRTHVMLHYHGHMVIWEGMIFNQWEKSIFTAGQLFREIFLDVSSELLHHMELWIQPTWRTERDATKNQTHILKLIFKKIVTLEEQHQIVPSLWLIEHCVCTLHTIIWFAKNKIDKIKGYLF